MHQDLQHTDQRRRMWIDERRASVIAAYDAEAATYDRHPYPNRPQQAWVKRLLTLCPDHGIVLDAPCGTGRYFPLVAAAGHRVVGIDQSANMLAEAQRRGLAIDLQQIGLQELCFVERFDAVMTIDAMENVAPRTGRAFSPTCTAPSGQEVTCTSPSRSTTTPTSPPRMRLCSLEDCPLSPAKSSTATSPATTTTPAGTKSSNGSPRLRLTLIDEAYHQEDGWGYRHLLLQCPTRACAPPSGEPRT